MLSVGDKIFLFFLKWALLAGLAYAGYRGLLYAHEATNGYVLKGFIAAAVLWACNLIIRSIALKTLQHYGLLHPRIDSAWPRFVPWRELQEYRKAFKEWWEENFSIGSIATGGFLPVLSTLLESYAPGDIVLGRARLWGAIPSMQYIGHKPDRSMLVFGMTGSGKTNWALEQIALTPDDASVVNIDVKGVAERTVMPPKKRRGLNVHTINVLSGKTASINITRLIKEINERCGQDMTTIIVEGIAQSLVPENPNEKPFFRIQAWEVWKAAILHEISINPDATLMDVYDRLMRGYYEYADDIAKSRELYFLALAENQSYDGFISRIGAMLASTDERTLSNILPSATGPTAWLGHKNTKRFLGPRHDFNLCDLKGNTPLILNMACPPGELRTTYAGFFRMMMYLTIKVLELCPNNLQRKAPTRIFWDEIQNTGPLPPAAATIWPQLRGFQALAIALPQDIQGLRAVAPDAYKTIMANSAVQMCFQTECDETIKYFCGHHLGQKTRTKKNRETGHVDETTIPVMQPDQLRRWLRFRPGKGGNVICARAGKRPLALRIVEYYRDCPVYLYDQDNEFPMPAGHEKGRVFWAKHFAPKAVPVPPAPDKAAKAKAYAKARHKRRRRAA